MIKKTIYIIVFIAFIVLMAIYFQSQPKPIHKEGIELTAEELEFLENADPVTVAMLRDHAPFSYTSSKGNEGYALEVARLISRKTGLKFQYSWSTWAENLEDFKHEKFDVITDISYKKERTEYTLYSEPYYEVPVVVFVREAFGKYLGIESLKGKKVGIIKDVFYESEVRKIDSFEVVEQSDSGDLVKDLVFGRTEALIHSLSAVRHAIVENDYRNIKLVGEVDLPGISKEDFRFGVNKSKPVLHSIIQKGMAAISKSEWAALKNRWFGLTLAHFNPSDELELTEEEKQFLKDHPVIRVSNEMDFPPLDFAIGRQPFGFSIDMITLISKKTGLTIEFVNGYNWPELVDLFKQKKIDVLHTLSKTVSRKKAGLFSEPYYSYKNRFVVRKGENDIQFLSQLRDKTISVGRGWSQQEYLQNNFPELLLKPADNASEILKSLSEYKADVAVLPGHIASYLIEKEQLKDLKISGWFREMDLEESSKYHFLVQKDKAILAEIINKALASLSKKEIDQLKTKWFGREGENTSRVKFTAAEKKFITDNKEISIGISKGLEPYVIENKDGSLSGLDIEYTQLIAEKTGLKINLVYDRHESVLKQAKENKIDAVASLVILDEHKKNFQLSDPYHSTVGAVIVQQGNPFHLKSFQDLKGRTMGIPKGYEVLNKFVKNHPGVKVVYFPDYKETLQALAKGEIDFTALDNSVFYLARKTGLNNFIEIGFLIDKALNLAFAVPKGNPVLTQILNKGIGAITEQEKNKIYYKWFARQEADTVAWAEVKLTPSEQKYIKDHKQIIIGTSVDHIPATVLEADGSVRGVNGDIIEIIRKKTGLNIQFKVDQWATLVAEAKKYKIDGLATTVNNPKRAEKFAFSKPYFQVAPVVIVKQGNPQQILKKSDFKGKKVAILKNSVSFRKYFQEYGGVEIVDADSALDIVKKLISGEADFTVNYENILLTAAQNGLDFLDIAFVFGDSRKIVFSLRKDQPELVSIFNKTLDSISEVEKENIKAKWFRYSRKQAAGAQKITLSFKEAEYLFSKQTLRACVEAANLPYSDISKQASKGIVAEILNYVSGLTGGAVLYHPVQSYAEAEDALTTGKCDFIAAAMSNFSAINSGLLFTKEYLSQPYVIATKNDFSFFQSQSDLQGKKIGITEKSGLMPLLKKRYPAAEIIETKDIFAGLEMVSRGYLAGMIGDLPAIAFNINQYSMVDLKVAGGVDEPFQLHMAVHEDSPVLYSILQKIIHSMDDLERRKLVSKWISVRYETGFDYKLFWQVLAVVGVIIVMILVWVILLKKEMQKRLVVEEKLRKRQEELEEAKKIAEEASVMKSEFLANMSHEIRTPLNAVTGFSELLSSMVQDEKQKNYLQAIKTAGRSLLVLINDILDLSKIEAGRLEIKKNFINIRDLIQEIQQVFSMQVSRKNLTFRVNIDSSLDKAVYIDEIRLRQVLLNLMGNAVKFTDRGTVKINAALKVASVQPHENRSSFDLHIEVEDTGIGIPQEELDQVFEAFKQQKHQNINKYGGTGLGLAISKKLTELMGGTISVNSEPGKGSRFSIVLKSITTSTERTSRVAQINALDSVIFEKARILVVDDIASNRELLVEMLAQVSLESMTANNGQEALMMVSEYLPDVILMDLRMPVMDGYEAVRNLKRQSLTKDIPVIAVSASNANITVEGLQEIGFESFLPKPVSSDDLVNELKTHLKVSRFQKEETVESVIDDTDKIDKLTQEELHSLTKLTRLLETGYFPKWEALQTRQPIDQVRGFAAELQQLGLEYNSKLVIEYGELILNSLENFDISTMLDQLSKFQDIIKQLRNQIRGNQDE